MVRTKDSCRAGTGSFPRGSKFYFPIFVTKLVCGNGGGDYEVTLCVGDVSCLFQNKGNRGCGKMQVVCVCGLLGMGDSLARGRGAEIELVYLRSCIVKLIPR